MVVSNLVTLMPAASDGEYLAAAASKKETNRSSSPMAAKEQARKMLSFFIGKRSQQRRLRCGGRPEKEVKKAVAHGEEDRSSM